MTLRFGTDGVRGRRPHELTDPSWSARPRAGRGAGAGPATACVIGRDTRESGPLLEAALAAGLAAEGADGRVARRGAHPGGGARVAPVDGVPGAVISASHNPLRRQRHQVLRRRAGCKLTDDVEEAARGGARPPIARRRGRRRRRPPTGAGAARRGRRRGGRPRYAAGRGRLARGPAPRRAARGASTAPTARRRTSRPTCSSALGADVGCSTPSPTARNINDGCGSTHPGDLQAAVVAAGADVGLAFDGDADRVAGRRRRRARWSTATTSSPSAPSTCATGASCADDTVVVTVMTNLGLPPGDGRARHRGGRDRRSATATCSRRSRPAAGSLGGEQSGHVIFRRPGHHRRRPAHRRAAARPGGPRRAGRWPSWPRRP